MKMYMLALSMAIMSTNVLSGQDLPKNSSSTDLLGEAKKTIRKVNSDWIIAVKNQDSKIMALPYGNEGVYVSVTGQCIQGSELIEEYFKERAKEWGTIADVKIFQEGIDQKGNYVYEYGRVEIQVGSEIETGRYFTVWTRKESKEWFILRNLSLL